MKRFSLFVLALFLGSVFCFSTGVLAEDAEEVEEDEASEEISEAATSISISPVSKILQLEPDTVYEDSFKISNNGKSPMSFEVYASPYSYTYSEEEDEYRLGFNRESSYTQITRWITFRDVNGEYVENPRFTAEPGGTVEIHYKISTPSSIPAGGQYAVLFAHTISESPVTSGIKTEASPGLIVYGRASGETIITGEVSNLVINKSLKSGEAVKNVINASAKAKNTGNVDFMASGQLKVTGIFGRVYYETPANRGRVSVIPEAELSVSDEWEDTPYFGLFNVTWTVIAAGEEESITRLVLILPAPVIVVMILLLTIIIVWIIIMVRKRKERRSRFIA